MGLWRSFAARRRCSARTHRGHRHRRDFALARYPGFWKINEDWDRDFLDRWVRGDRDTLLAYTDEDIYRDAGQGGFEIRTMIAISGLCAGNTGEIWCYQPIPIFAVGCTIGVMSLAG